MIVTLDLSKLSAETRKRIEQEIGDRNVISALRAMDSKEQEVIAQSVFTNVDTLDKLSTYPDWRVRLCVASNIRASKRTLERLLYDDNEEVRVAAEINLRK